MNAQLAAILDVLSKTFALPPNSVAEEASMHTLPEWDSLAHLSLMAALEERFERTVEPEDMVTLTSVSAISQFLAKAVHG